MKVLIFKIIVGYYSVLSNLMYLLRRLRLISLDEYIKISKKLWNDMCDSLTKFRIEYVETEEI